MAVNSGGSITACPVFFTLRSLGPPPTEELAADRALALDAVRRWPFGVVADKPGDGGGGGSGLSTEDLDGGEGRRPEGDNGVGGVCRRGDDLGDPPDSALSGCSLRCGRGDGTADRLDGEGGCK